jgi:DNA repair protein RadC
MTDCNQFSRVPADCSPHARAPRTSPTPTKAATSGPREQLLARGPEHLTDEALVALLLSCGAEGKPVLELAQEVLRHAGGLAGIPRLGIGALSQLRGMGLAKACRMLAAHELGQRMLTQPLDRSKPIASGKDIDVAFRPRLQHETREHFVAVALDVRMRPIAQFTVAIGGLVTCAVTAADAFRYLVREAAALAVFVHNHPSGSPAPSMEDIVLTEQLQKAGALLGITVFDHVIVGSEGYFSFRDAGLLCE